MKGSEFLRLVRRVGRERNVEIVVDQKRGKGSHSVLVYRSRKTVLKDINKELGTGLLNAMLRDLGLTLNEIQGRRRRG